MSTGRRDGSVWLSELVEVPLERLRLWPENPRWTSDERLDDLARGLDADRPMLNIRPLGALLDGTVFMGNQRLLAARKLKWKTIPVIYVDLPWERARLWALRDNNAYGEWDEPKLADLLTELKDRDVDLLLTGFSGSQIDRILDGIPAPAEPDEVPPLPAEPETRPGELVELGPHRLLCGDARSSADLGRLIGSDRARLVLTDPPYGVSYTGKTAAALTIANDDQAGLEELLNETLAAVGPYLTPAACFYLFAPAGPLETVFRAALERSGWTLRQGLVWVKNAFVLGHGDYHYQHETLLYGRGPGAGRPGRGRRQGGWYGGHNQASVLFCDRPRRSDAHPTVKPVELLATLLKNSTRRGDIVLDPFCGSGSTLIACEMLGRRCLAIEIDPAYCDVVRRRYREFIGG